MKAGCWLLVVVGGATLVTPASARRASNTDPVPIIETRTTDESVRAELGLGDARFTIASSNTTVLGSWTFDVGGQCDPQGWVEVDMTAQLGDYFHIDDYAGLPFGPLRGSKSLWCGARAAATPVLCGYATLPGYGNNWDQAFCTKACLQYSGMVAVDYLARWDSEPNYDFTTLEYTTQCTTPNSWTEFAGGYGEFDGIGEGPRHDTFPAPSQPVRIRVHFQSDIIWSDEDGLWPTNGALHLDSLSVRDGSGLRIAVEDFEGEAVGATSATDWESCTPPGYGSYAFVTRGCGILQEDPCVSDVSCLWAFFEGSLNTYACGGFPEQKAIPKVNGRGQALNNEIWSPTIPLVGAGSNVVLRFAAYRDNGYANAMFNTVFYIWHVRSLVNGHWGPWKDFNFVYFGGQKDWFTNVFLVGPLLDLASATDVQIALGVVDMCPAWCPDPIEVGLPCYGHAPMLDNVELLRVDESNTQWTINDINQFQDNFASNGTTTGVVRADMAKDLLPRASPHIIPGDSAVVIVTDPVAGIANDVNLGGKKVYAYVAVWPQGQATKTGANLSGGARWPFAGTQVIGGVTWTCLRLDQCVVNGNPVANVFCIDLKDDLFTPGDTICFFYCAENTNGVKTYAFGSSLSQQGDDANQAAANAAEFTCLPAGGWQRGGDILYVDGMDGRGAQPYWDTAFQSLQLLDKIDRYDVRGPSSSVNNRLAGRVTNVGIQLLNCYRGIVWDCGDLSQTLGDGSHSAANPEKTNDYGLINTFLNNLANPGGVYLCGDDLASQLNNSSGASAVTFRTTYMTYTLTTGNHRPTFGVTPLGVGVPGEIYTGDTFYIYGGCPLLNDFDVMDPTGSTSMVLSYGPATETNGAVLYKRTTNSNNVQVGVQFSGFSFIYVRDDENNGIMDRAKHAHAILEIVQVGTVPSPTGSGSIAKNALSQNYPNPFNPQTTIAFSLKERGRVSLAIYNVAGERIRTLASEMLDAGAHVKVWDGRDDRGQPVSSGVYFYRLKAGGFEQTKKMVLLK